MSHGSAVKVRTGGTERIRPTRCLRPRQHKKKNRRRLYMQKHFQKLRLREGRSRLLGSNAQSEIWIMEGAQVQVLDVNRGHRAR